MRIDKDENGKEYISKWCLNPRGTEALAHGGSGGIYFWLDKPGEVIKLPWSTPSSIENVEIEKGVFKRLGCHPNIVPCLRIADTGPVSVVAEHIVLKRAEHGSIREFFRNGVLAALKSEDSQYGPDDVLQMFAVARHWAAEGDEEVRQTLYDVFARDAFQRAEISCGEYLVKMDGIGAFQFIVPLLERIPEEDRQRNLESLVAELEERDGKEPVAEAAGTQHVKRPPEYSAEELQTAAKSLLSETDEKRLWDYLRIFRTRRFPGPHARLIELAKHGSWRLSHAAAKALTHIDDPELRALALELVANPERCDLGVTLLAARSQRCDYGLIEQALKQQLDEGLYHSLGLSVLGFVKANLNGGADASLMWIYENGPCSFCRHSSVKYLVTLNRLPDWLRQECLHDADSETRELVCRPEHSAQPWLSSP